MILTNCVCVHQPLNNVQSVISRVSVAFLIPLSKHTTSYACAQMDNCGPVNTVCISPTTNQAANMMLQFLTTVNMLSPTICIFLLEHTHTHTVLFEKLHYTCSPFIQTPSHGTNMFQPIYTHIPPLLHYTKPKSFHSKLQTL